MESTAYTPRALVHVCAACSLRHALLRCTRCMAVRYCNDECRISHQLAHYPNCYHIRRWGSDADSEMSRADFLVSKMATLDGLEISVSIFQARILTQRSAQASKLMGMMIRVGMEQEAYNLLKVWVILDLPNRPSNFWPTLPWPPAQANALEDPDFLAGTVPNFICAVYLLLLKLKMFLDVRNLAISYTETPPQTPELRLIINNFIVNSSLGRQFIEHNTQSLGQVLSTLLRQIKYIGAFINQSGFLANMEFFFRQIRSNEQKPLLDDSLKDVVPVVFETDGVMELLNDAYERAAGVVTGDEIIRQVWHALETGGMEL